jgi:hypothetical protein
MLKVQARLKTIGIDIEFAIGSAAGFLKALAGEGLIYMDKITSK